MENIEVQLNVQNLRKQRQGEDLFSPVQFVLHRGEGLALHGPNGSGKSTLLDILAGLQKASGGSFGCAPGTRLGYVMQQDGFQETLSCRDNLLHEAALCGYKGKTAKEQAYACAAACDILSFWKKRVSRCSAGMRARLAIAAALLPQPTLLFLDEAFAALDTQNYQSMRQLIYEKKQQGMAVLMVSHNTKDYKGLCERVLVLPKAEVLPL